jgi:hypothetical protein
MVNAFHAQIIPTMFLHQEFVFNAHRILHLIQIPQSALFKLITLCLFLTAKLGLLLTRILTNVFVLLKSLLMMVIFVKAANLLNIGIRLLELAQIA